MTISRTMSDSTRLLERLADGPLTIAVAIKATREGEGLSQAEFARLLGISRSHLCDIEKARKGVSPERAAEFAQKLGYSERQWVRLALQDLIDRVGLSFKIDVRAA